MNEQKLKQLEESWELWFTVEIGIDRTEFLRRIDEIQKMVHNEAPIPEILDKVNELQGLMKSESITSNTTDMNK